MTVQRGQRAPRPNIVITDALIEQAKRRDSGHCMIAEAVKAAVPHARSVSVDLASIRWTDPESALRYTFLTPRVAQLALVQFDQGDENIEPFSFRLRGALVTQSHMKKPKAKGTPRTVSTKTSLVKADGGKPGVATRVGGKTPPLGPLSNSKRVRVGKRREFGLRTISR